MAGADIQYNAFVASGMGFNSSSHDQPAIIASSSFDICFRHFKVRPHRTRTRVTLSACHFGKNVHFKLIPIFGLQADTDDIPYGQENGLDHLITLSK